MKKPVKRKKVVKKPKEDNKSDVIYVGYLLEDMDAVIALIPEDEKTLLAEAKVDELLLAVKKAHTRVKTISTLFKQKYASARFDKVESISHSVLKKGQENPRFRYTFLLNAFINLKTEIGKSINK